MQRSISGGGVVISSEGKVLVVNQDGLSWSLPKGRLESDETPRSAAEREIAEETGVTVLNFLKELGSYERYQIGLDGRDNKNLLKEIHMFLYTTPQTDLHPTDPANPEARWVEPAKVAELLTHPKDQQFFQSVQVEIDTLLREPTA